MRAFDIAKDIRDRHKNAIMNLPDVVGSGIGADNYGDPVIHIYLTADTHRLAYSDLIQNIEGVPVAWDRTGEIVATAFEGES